MSASRRATGSTTDARRGVALLLVLATLLVVSTAALLLVRTRATASLGRRIDDRTVAIDDAITAAEGRIAAWLQNEAATAVVDPDAPSIEIPILDDLIVLEGVATRIRVAAFDQQAMLPWDDARSGSPLRMALPAAVSARLRDRPEGRRTSPGLDLLPLPRPGEAPTFPRISPGPPDAMPIAFGAGTQAEPAGVESSKLFDSQTTAPAASPAVGAWLATHAPSPAAINVNTAPIELLDAAMRRLGRGGLEPIIEARRARRHTALAAPTATAGGAGPGARSSVRGQSQRSAASRSAGNAAGINAPSLPAAAGRPAGGAANGAANGEISLVSQSAAWAFRIDAVVEGTSRSTWSVWRLEPAGWGCVQRLEVIE